MNTDRNSNDEWEPCAPGMLSHKPDPNIDQSRRKLLMKTGLGAILAATGFRIVVDARSLKPDPMTDFIPCIEVQAHLAGYVAKKITDEDLNRKIQLHLGVCTHCLSSYDELTS